MDDDPTQNARQALTACRPLRRLWFLVFLLPLFPLENGGEARPLVDCVSVVGVKTEGGKTTSRSTPGMRTGFVYDDIYLRDEPACGHPERPERLTAIVARLEDAGLLSQLERFQPRPVTEKWLTAVHSADYVRRACAESCSERYTAALFAVGGVLTAVDAVVAGKVRNAFCTVRPPGHHATKDRGGGYCVFNNVAIAARYAQQKHRLAKVLIVDWDVHHGNGTQSIFYDDPSVLYFSVHRAQIYGPTGTAAERGKGKGLGFTINVPLAAGSGNAEYRRAFEEELLPAARRFHPDLVLVSAGFDASQRGRCGMKVTAKGFADLTGIVKAIASDSCNGRLVTVLEGGYNLIGVAECAESHVRSLLE